MTREQIEAQIRADNPTTTDEAGERHGPGSEVYEAAIQRWADAMEASLGAAAGKSWPSKREFDAEFTDAETYGIEISSHPTLVVLRGRLNRWEGEILASDERVQAAFAKLVEVGILSPERRDEILTP
jgi:hypothetical protein